MTPNSAQVGGQGDSTLAILASIPCDFFLNIKHFKKHWPKCGKIAEENNNLNNFK